MRLSAQHSDSLSRPDLDATARSLLLQSGLSPDLMRQGLDRLDQLCLDQVLLPAGRPEPKVALSWPVLSSELTVFDEPYAGDSSLSGYYIESSILGRAKVLDLPLGVKYSLVQNSLDSKKTRHRIQLDLRVEDYFKSKIDKSKIGDLLSQDLDPQNLLPDKSALLEMVRVLALRQILTHEKVLRQEARYREQVLRYDSLKQAQEGLEDSIGQMRRYLEGLQRLRDYYNSNMELLNAAAGSLEQAPDSLIGLANARVRAFRERLNSPDQYKEILRQNKLLSEAERLLLHVKALRIGTDQLQYSRYTADDLIYQGGKVVYSPHAQRSYEAAGGVFFPNPTFVSLPGLHKALQLARGSFAILRRSQETEEGDLSSQTLQWARMLDSNQVQRNNLVLHQANQMRLSSRLRLESNLAASLVFAGTGPESPAAEKADLKALIRRAAGDLQAEYSLTENWAIYLKTSYFGAEYSSFCNPFLLNNRLLAEAGISAKARWLEGKAGYQYGAVLEGPSSRISRFNIQLKSQVSKYIRLALLYSPMVYYSRPNSTRQISESSIFSLSASYYRTLGAHSLLYSLSLNNMKNHVSALDTQFLTDRLLLSHQLSWMIGQDLAVLGHYSRGIHTPAGAEYFLQGGLRYRWKCLQPQMSLGFERSPDQRRQRIFQAGLQIAVREHFQFQYQLGSRRLWETQLTGRGISHQISFSWAIR